MTNSMIEGLLGLTSIFILCMASIAFGVHTRKQEEKKEVQDKERLKQVRAETNQYLKEQGYKPKIKIEIKDNNHSCSTRKSSPTRIKPKPNNNRDSNDDYHRRMEIIRNSNLGE